MIKNRFLGVLLSLSLLLSPTISFGCGYFDLICHAKEKAKELKRAAERELKAIEEAAKKAAEAAIAWTKVTYTSAEKGLEEAVNHGIKVISDLPDQLQELIKKELKKLETKVKNSIKDAIETKDIQLSKNTHKINHDMSGKFSKIIVDVTNNADITSLGAISASFSIGIKDYAWTKKKFTVSLGDSVKQNWINSVKTSQKPDYDVTLKSTLSGKIVLLGGGTKISSIVESKYYNK